MADKTPEKETEETKKPAGLVGLVVPLIIVMVLMPTVAYLTTEHFLADKFAQTIAGKLDGVEFISSKNEEDKKEDKKEGDKKGGKEGEDKEEDTILISSQLVNIKNTNGSRNLYVSYVIVGKKNEGLGSRIENSILYKAKCKERTSSIISEFGLTEINSKLTRATAVAQMIASFNDIFEDEDPVEDVVLEGWTVQ